MASLNPSIILAGQGPSPINALAQGVQAGQQTVQARRQNALNAAMEQYGPGARQGDEQALNALSRFDPNISLGIQESRLGMDATRHGMAATDRRLSQQDRQLGQADQRLGMDRERLDLAREEKGTRLRILGAQEARAAEQHMLQMDEAERAADIAEDKRVISELITLPDAASWDAFSRESGHPEFVGMFDNKDRVLAQVLDLETIYKSLQPPAPQSPEGKLAADVRAGYVEPGAGDEGEALKGADDLRNEFKGTGVVKDFADQAQSYRRILDSASNSSAAGDMALIFNFMKMLDPGSTVREGEFATAEQAAGVPARIVGLYNRAINGERLTEETRQDFVGRAANIYQGAERGYADIEQQYIDMAERRGLPVEDVVINYRYQGPGYQPPAPAPAAPEEGNSGQQPQQQQAPASQTSWRDVQPWMPGTGEAGEEEMRTQMAPMPQGFAQRKSVQDRLKDNPDLTAEDIWKFLPNESRRRFLENGNG